MEKEGGERSILEVSLTKIDSYENSDDLIIMLAEDITDEQDTQAALIQSEKLALTGRLAASLAHEINNPLQTSIGCLGLADEMLNDEDSELSVYINMAMEELQRSARIVKKLRDLNRNTDIKDKEPIDLQEILDGVLVLTKNRLYDRNIVPVYPYQGPPPILSASKDQIQQVLLNLVMNAIDALPEGGNIYLDILHTDDPQGFTVKIRDTGVGMTKEVMENLFDPFFTTKEEGLGLGLYICKRIIGDHNGKLSVESEPGQGTEFSVWLPGLDVDIQDEEEDQ
jgi:signal transduction histidine kinase